jgi:hypothetical protein
MRNFRETVPAICGGEFIIPLRFTSDEAASPILFRSNDDRFGADRPPSSGPGGMLVESWPLR